MKTSQQQHLHRLGDMVTLTGGSHPAITIRNYLAPLEKMFGDDFDPQRALDDLIRMAEILKKELAKP